MKRFRFPITSFAAAAVFNISTVVPGVAYPASASIGGWIANFYTFALLIGGILAFGAIVYGGVKYAFAHGNPSGESDAKGWIWSALLGLLLLASAYLILYTVNPNLVTLALPNVTPVNIPSTAGAGGTGGTAGGTSGGTTPSAGGAVPSSLAAQDLSGAGVSIKPGASVDGMQQGTINDVDNLSTQCAAAEGGSCNVIITSGTEGDHAAGECSHANGYKADLNSANTSLDSFITSLPKAGVRGDGAQLYSYNGGTIADETNLSGVAPHWDLSATCP